MISRGASGEQYSAWLPTPRKARNFPNAYALSELPCPLLATLAHRSIRCSSELMSMPGDRNRSTLHQEEEKLSSEVAKELLLGCLMCQASSDAVPCPTLVVVTHILVLMAGRDCEKERLLGRTLLVHSCARHQSLQRCHRDKRMLERESFYRACWL